MRYLVLLSTVLFLANSLAAQDKKPLDHNVYDFWNKTKQHAISEDGSLFLYVVRPENGDGSLTFKKLVEEKEYVIARGDSAAFSYGTPYAVFLKRAPLDSVKKAKQAKKKGTEAPQDSLGMIDLENGDVEVVDVAASYRMPEKAGGWVAWLTKFPAEEKATADTSAAIADTLQESESETKKDNGKKPRGRKLTLHHFESDSSRIFNNVSDYRFSEDGRFLALTLASEDSSADGVQVVSLENGKVSTLMQTPGDYRKLAWSTPGSHLAFIANSDSIDTKQKAFALYLADTKSMKATAIARQGSRGLPEGWWISPHAKVEFSEAGKRILFGSAPRPEPEPEEEQKEEQAVLDIWHWKDPLLQPMQLKQLKQEQKRSYLAVYDLGKKTILQLGREDIPEIKLSDQGDGRFALGLSNLPYRMEISWDYPEYHDFYLIDLKNGRSRMVAERVQSAADISPQGRYIYWWDRQLGEWRAYDNERGKEISLSGGIAVSLVYHLHDWPFPAGSEGSAGWTEDDARFVLYDQYDIWAVDPSKPLEPVNLTGGKGRERGEQLRYIKLDKDQRALPEDEPWLLELFDYDDKRAGYAQVHPQKEQSFKVLVKAEKRFARTTKAENADVLIYTREDFREFSDFWVSDPSFEDPRKISNINPQQDEYLWGTAEQAEWVSLDGQKLQGIIYKPANFDLAQKYPMMVYFYEKSSHNLYRHWEPEPHRSIINFSFYASRGYVIFIPDIPYKTGFPGESAYDAVMAGVNHMIEKGYVDRERIGVQGHSWGGYQIAYMITRTNLFRVAEAGAPVANMTSAYGGIRWGTGKSRMFQYEMTQSRIGGTLWEKPLLYIENSPLFFADQIETPLLIMHNDQDGHVPWYQGIELFTALRRLGKPSWLINYNNQPHWPITFVNKKDWAIRLQQYFDYYLKDAPPARWIIEGVPALKKGKTLGTELIEQEN